MDVINFCDKAINKVSEEIEKTEIESKAKFDTNEFNVIFSTLEKMTNKQETSSKRRAKKTK